MSASEILDKVGPIRALIMGAVLVASIAYSAGLLTAERLDIPADHEKRITANEVWRARHDTLVTDPGVRRLGALETRVERLEGQGPQIQNMVFELWCDRFPDRCSATPTSRGGPK